MIEHPGKWRRLRAEYGPDLKLFRARFDYMKNPRNQATERMIILESPDSANVVALTPDKEMLFVRQYRFGIGDYTLELPGGIIDEGEEPETAARRELREETGFTGQSWQLLGKIPSNPVFQNSWIYHFLVTDSQKTHNLTLDPGEDVELVRIPIDEVRKGLYQGAFQHPHTVNALVRYLQDSSAIL